MSTIASSSIATTNESVKAHRPLQAIVRGTFRGWWRDALAQAVILALVGLLGASAALQYLGAAEEAAHRSEHQAEADAIFEAQPDRHPHRMVHYGHYVFRSPAPLAVIEPGVDGWTGRSIFLEGHRRNTPTFAASREASLLARFGELSPAFVLQVLVPLVLVLLGAGAIASERERGTELMLLAQGLPARTLRLGKAIALAIVALSTLVPIALVGAVLALQGIEGGAPIAVLVVGHALYLLGWTALVVGVSARCSTRGSALVTLFVAWAALVVLVPRLASELTMATHETPLRAVVQIETARALHEVGDGHNGADPAFARFKDGILAQYGVTRIEDLPVNWRGLVAGRGEADGKVVLDRFAEARLAREQAQSDQLARFGWLSPLLAMRTVSTTAAGTDLSQHHRFLQEAEAYRFDFVQRLNRLHAEGMSYAVDMARNTSAEAGQRARVSAENWAAIPDFEFAVAPARERAAAALAALGPLLLWCLLAGALLLRVDRRGGAA